MKTVTFGAGGDYSNSSLAYEAQTWTEDILFQEVGNSVHSTIIMEDQSGATAIFRGGGYIVQSSVDFFEAELSTVQNGTIIFEYFDIQYVADNIITLEIDAITGAGDIYFRYNKVAVTSASYANSLLTHYGLGSGKTYIYGNDVNQGVAFADAFFLLGNTSEVYIEDNIVTDIGVSGSVIYTDSPTKLFCRRNYFNSGKSGVFDGSANAAPQILTETFTSIASDADLSASYENIPFDTTEFISTTLSDEFYGVPKEDSALTTAASDTTSIPDNIIGLNGVLVGIKTAGCYAQPVFVDAPIGVDVEYISEGVKVTWTPVVTIGYERTKIYWEVVNIESAFVTPKAFVDAPAEGEIPSYTIPYDDLATSFIWYLKLSHGA